MSRGFTLTELLITVTIIAILAAVAMPNMRKSIELGYRREAVDLLNTIYTGERTRLFESGSYYFGAAAPLDGSDPNGEWRQIFMDDPNVSSIPVAFTVTGAATTFQARATRTDGTGRFIEVNQNKEWCGPSNDSPDACFDTEWVVN